MRTLIYPTVFILLLAAQLYPQITQEWAATLNLEAEDLRAIDIDSEGNVFATGVTGFAYGNWLTVKFSTDGDTVWYKTFNGPANDYDQVYDIAVDKWGNAIVCGTSKRIINQYISKDYVFAKYNGSNGNIDWEYWYDNPNYQANDDDAWQVKVDTSGRVYVTGQILGGSPQFLGTGFDWLSVCKNPNGSDHWIDIWDGDSTADGATGIEVSKDGVAFIVGYTYQNGFYELKLVKKDFYGPDYEKRFNTNGAQPLPELTIDQNKNAYVATNFGFGTESDIYVFKYDSLGNLKWSKIFRGPYNRKDFPRGIAVDSEGNVILLAEVKDIDDKSLTYTVKYSNNGDSLWTKVVDGTYKYPKAIKVDNLNNIYITGRFGNIPFIKYSPDGDQEWIASYNGTGSFSGVDIALGSNFNVYVGGNLTAGGVDYCVIKYSQTVSSINSDEGFVPSDFYVSQNYPNPFNPSTKISWQVPVGSWQTLKVYDVLGNEIATLVNEYKPAGAYNVEFRVKNVELSSGIYFYQLKAGDYIQTKKMILLK